jgi:hypothetical protein
MRTYREDIERLLGTVGAAGRMAKQYERVIAGTSAFRAYEDLLRPRLLIQEQIDRLTSALSLQDTIEKYASSNFLSQLDKYNDFVASNSIAAAMQRRSTIDQFQSSSAISAANSYSEMLQSAMGRLSEINRPFAELDAVRRFQQLLDDSLLSQVSFAEDGAITVNGYAIDASTTADDIRAMEDIAQHGVSALSAIVNALQSLAPYVRAVVLYVLLPYLISIIANINTPMHEEWWKSVRGQNNREATKEVKANSAIAYSPDDLRQFRFIKRPEISVRLTRSIQSPKLDELYFGKVVRLLKRERDWSFIEYVDTDTTELRQGWVLSRYLSRFDQ